MKNDYGLKKLSEEEYERHIIKTFPELYNFSIYDKILCKELRNMFHENMLKYNEISGYIVDLYEGVDLKKDIDNNLKNFEEYSLKSFKNVIEKIEKVKKIFLKKYMEPINLYFLNQHKFSNIDGDSNIVNLKIVRLKDKIKSFLEKERLILNFILNGYFCVLGTEKIEGLEKSAHDVCKNSLVGEWMNMFCDVIDLYNEGMGIYNFK